MLDAGATGATTVPVPTIVIAELVMIAEKRRLQIDMDSVADRLFQNVGFQLIPLLPRVALSISDLDDLPDIHDRLIVADALAAGASVITRDETIAESALVETVW